MGAPSRSSASIGWRSRAVAEALLQQETLDGLAVEKAFELSKEGAASAAEITEMLVRESQEAEAKLAAQIKREEAELRNEERRRPAEPDRPKKTHRTEARARQLTKHPDELRSVAREPHFFRALLSPHPLPSLRASSPEPEVMTLIAEQGSVVDDTIGSRLFQRRNLQTYAPHANPDGFVASRTDNKE